MAFEAWLLLYECCRRTLNRKEALRHHAVSLRQHGFLVIIVISTCYYAQCNFFAHSSQILHLVYVNANNIVRSHLLARAAYTLY